MTCQTKLIFFSNQDFHYHLMACLLDIELRLPQVLFEKKNINNCSHSIKVYMALGLDN